MPLNCRARWSTLPGAGPGTGGLPGCPASLTLDKWCLTCEGEEAGMEAAQEQAAQLAQQAKGGKAAHSLGGLLQHVVRRLCCGPASCTHAKHSTKEGDFGQPSIPGVTVLAAYCPCSMPEGRQAAQHCFHPVTAGLTGRLNQPHQQQQTGSPAMPEGQHNAWQQRTLDHHAGLFQQVAPDVLAGVRANGCQQQRAQLRGWRAGKGGRCAGRGASTWVGSNSRCNARSREVWAPQPKQLLLTKALQGDG